MENFISIAILLGTLRIATPLILAALGGVFSEKSGVVNIALEGIMLMGAFMSIIGTYITKNPWIGVLCAMLVGALFAYMHAIVSIKFKANQVVSGTAINILALGATTFIQMMLINTKGTLDIANPELDTLKKTWYIPGAAKALPEWQIPGTEITFTPIVYIAIVLVLLSWIILYKTPLGLRIRAVGEHPHAADTVGINVYNMRYLSVIISGILAGLGGAHLAIGSGTYFVSGMTGGRGFIALAAMIFGRWHPIGAAAAALLFAYFDKIQIGLSKLTIGGVLIPSQFIAMIPYVMTIIVLAGVMGKATPPAADGVPYEKGER